MMVALYKRKVFDISKALLSLLIVSINIREPFFHTRELFFFLFIVTSIRFANYKNLICSLLLLSAWSVSAIYNLLFEGSNINFGDGGFETIIAAVYLFLVCFSEKKYAETIIRAYLFVSTLVAFVIITFWILCSLSPILYSALKFFFDDLKERRNLMICSIDKRMILGVQFMGIYYRTSPCIICALGYCLIEKLKGNENRNLLIIIYTFALFFTAARANMMCAVLLLLVYIVFQLLKNKHFAIAFLLILFCLFSAILFAILFLNDKGSHSSSIKAGHQQSYFDVFGTDYLRTIFFGWGAGSSFYSLGRHKFVNVTELSHLETVRRYGFLQTLVIFIFIWFRPMYNKFSREKSILKYFYLVVLLAYIFTACTNPFLIDSFGFCALLFFLTYFDYGDIQNYKSQTEIRG